MKIAVVGSGISGNVAAYELSKEHDVTVYEKNDYVGGHTHTHTIEDGGTTHQIDTGFIVLNNRTYPRFKELLSELDVPVQDTEMSFSVKCEDTGLEYNGNNLNTLFAQRSNLVNPKFYKMILDILRFNREASEAAKNISDQSLGEFLHKGGYSEIFIKKYIIPMGAAIWSTKPNDMFRFPATFFFSFFLNHGLLSVNNRPQWHVIKGGSNNYVKKLTKSYEKNIRKSCAVECIVRFDDHVEIITDDYGYERYDYVFIASHSDQALEMLGHSSDIERTTLSAIEYQANEAVLHTDSSVLPKRKTAWASWNYHLNQKSAGDVALTYNMNILQGIQSDNTYCVTLNNTASIASDKIIKKIQYHHPLFTPAAVAAQSNHRLLNGTSRTYYCGAYWRNGFHEDGVVSALDAISHFKQDISYEQKLSLRWAS